jgi:hypothetical protein
MQQKDIRGSTARYSVTNVAALQSYCIIWGSYSELCTDNYGKFNKGT